MNQPTTQPTTLITFLGGNRGKDPQSPIYESAQYQFADSLLIKSSYFAEALLQSKTQNIQQVFILGSRTSIWELLIQDQNETLALEILHHTEDAEGAGISTSQLAELEVLISQDWGIPVRAYAGEIGIRADNVLSEMMAYDALLALIPNSHEVLIDFTHGFRSMPLLLLSALRFRASLSPYSKLNQIRLIYGELNRNGISAVHILDDLWVGMRVAQAARLFFEKFEGEELALEVESFCPKGAAAIRKISLVIQSNCLYKIEDSLRQLKNSLKQTPANTPQWFVPIQEKLQELIRHLLLETLHECIFALAFDLAECRLYIQAFIALDESLLELILLKHGKSGKKMLFSDIKNLKYEALPSGHELWKISNMRNAFAHGGRQIGVNEDQYLKKRFDQLYQLLLPYVKHPQKLDF